jgi:protein arginine N-methyltransferase 5
MTRKEEEAKFTLGERLCSSYNDVIQAPLQPLMDNLESGTYEVFEQDPVKYYRYEQAISLALHRVQKLLLLPSEQARGEGDAQEIRPVVVMVVGAGRGPLVQAALSAASSTGVPIRVFAVEKNTNAVITLRNRCITESWSNVGACRLCRLCWVCTCACW